MSDTQPSFDSAWKDALDAYFPDLLALLWPELHALIDWSHAPVFLDKELQALMRSAKRGQRHVDKLVSLHLRDGTQTLLLIHVEIQAGSDADFPHRIYTYYVRLHERHADSPLVSLAILTDQRSGSDSHMTLDLRFWDCYLHFTFPVVRLEDWRTRMDELDALAPTNPFAVVMLAQLEANTRHPGKQRLVRKTELVRSLRRWGFGDDNIRRLFRIIDAMMALPAALEPAFEQAVHQIEEETRMTYITSVERVRLKRERNEGMTKGAAGMLATLITQKFGPLPDWAKARLDQADETALNRWAPNILHAQRIEDVFAG